MVRVIVFCCLLLALLLLSSHAAGKPVATTTPSPHDPILIRQGGDTIADAFAVTLPYCGEGTTTGYTNDYDEVCPYAGSTSPDVVYTFTAPYSMPLIVDLHGSSYDTKVYVYDAELNLIDCNDDFYPDYTSKLENVPVEGGQQYYVVVDGYGGAHGDYEVGIWEWDNCQVDCPPGSQQEGEPPLVDGHLDGYNGGCDSLADLGYAPFQDLTGPDLCATTGWYHDAAGAVRRDTDWFTFDCPAGGGVQMTADADWPITITVYQPSDCVEMTELGSYTAGPCIPTELAAVNQPGAEVWIRVTPQSEDHPCGSVEYEFPYVFYAEVVAVEDHSWSSVKALFR